MSSLIPQTMWLSVQNMGFSSKHKQGLDLVVRIWGGLGNQMFGYAFAKALEHFTQDEVICECSFFLTNKHTKDTPQPTIRNLELSSFALSLPLNLHFDSKAFFASYDSLFKLYRIYKNFIPKAYRRCGYRYAYEETPSLLSQVFYNPSSFPHYAYFYGYFHNLAYFAHITHQIRQDFTLLTPLSEINQKYKSLIKATPNATFVHIRRGDYLLKQNEHFVRLGKSYYERAFVTLKQIYPNAHLFIFSNDISYCKAHFTKESTSNEHISTQGLEFSLIEGNDEGSAAQEMELMRSCENAIIANSTFSWWAAYLIENPHKIVIAPSVFLGTANPLHQSSLILPKEWIAL
ncbi:alpha-1,2-fucosyltransferase [Helicobacter sp. MIT 21-1697]|uniref:alpha-1,2-fucosyltransferase n=1 Tax=Helicobacter sp. MIT 21-1697 TaxID=2993733 RepID=UPI00224B5A07|nr:alpha-1,2-fucosyltransferase [Helicobacter sp. MIT 21-1697]MCX2717836.1 alpha-1,2-fucosyltransferase [Helicobacter sp. MIT 21-1697]